MSTNRNIVINCDGMASRKCSRKSSFVAQSLNLRYAREEARLVGWHSSFFEGRRVDICRDCWWEDEENDI